MGQRLVLNLRELRVQPDATSDISQEVARQMALMEHDAALSSDVRYESDKDKGQGTV